MGMEEFIISLIYLNFYIDFIKSGTKSIEKCYSQKVIQKVFENLIDKDTQMREPLIKIDEKADNTE